MAITGVNAAQAAAPQAPHRAWHAVSAQQQPAPEHTLLAAVAPSGPQQPAPAHTSFSATTSTITAPDASAGGIAFVIPARCIMLIIRAGLATISA